MVRTPFAALPNILAGRALVPEWLQGEATSDNIVGSLQPLLADTDVARRQVAAFDSLHRELRLGFAQRAATAISGLVSGGRATPTVTTPGTGS
jgi:lipid-A-disaccharide synthase